MFTWVSCMLGKKFYLTLPQLKRFHVVCPWLHATTVEETHDDTTQSLKKLHRPLGDIDKLCLWMNGASDITTRVWTPACLHSFGLLEHWLESPHPSAIIIFPHRNSGRHHYHGTTVCGLMASYFHNPYLVVAIEGDCSCLISLPIYSSISFFC